LRLLEQLRGRRRAGEMMGGGNESHRIGGGGEQETRKQNDWEGWAGGMTG